MYMSTSSHSKALLSAVAAFIKTLLSNPPEKLPALLHIISVYQQPGRISSYNIEYLPCVCGVDSSESWLCLMRHSCCGFQSMYYPETPLLPWPRWLLLANVTSETADWSSLMVVNVC